VDLKENLSKIKSGIFGLSLGKKVFCSIILIGVILTIGLAGSVPPQNLQVVNGQQYLSKVSAESLRPAIGYESNAPTTWDLTAGPSTASTQLNSPAIVNFSGFFQPSTNPSNAQISRKLSVNVRAYPILFIQVQVAKGVSYGIRFFTASGGNTVQI